jgi:predicted transcriptional regulator
MATVKEKIHEIVEMQPEDSSYDEILVELALARMVDRGLEDSKQGRVISNEDIQRRILEWRK